MVGVRRRCCGVLRVQYSCRNTGMGSETPELALDRSRPRRVGCEGECRHDAPGHGRCLEMSCITVRAGRK